MIDNPTSKCVRGCVGVVIVPQREKQKGAES